MTALLGAFVALPGLALGSFLNVVAARVPERRSVVRPGSACPSCSTEIAWYDNIPVVSWMLLRGRCRTCDTRIGVVYPLVELATAGLLVACVLDFGLTFRTAAAAVLCVALVVVTATDLTHRIVPNVVVLPAAVAAFVLMTAWRPSPEWAAGALGASGFLLLVALVYPGGMGMGDVKLALLMGAALGRFVPVALFVGMIFALVPSIVLLARHGSRARKMAIPFAPFLALGSLVALFGGHAIVHGYLTLF